MEKVILEMPAVWSDHHVLAVRNVLLELGGVETIYASSAWKYVMVEFDAAQVSQADIERCLADAGYPVGEGAPPILAQPGKVQRDPQWEILGYRGTQTNRVDLEMSGEFRRY